nr:bifunctional UDP-N-acetylmuramoyl-tripeptide:D-alanyl-D-alanine ligase/alanine racemase [Bacteroidales bacterium]
IRRPRSYNSQLGVPLSVWQLNDDYDFGIIEAGISMPGEMQKLEAIVSPDIGILTNIGSAHSENFISKSQKLEEKLTLFKHSKKLIFNKDLHVDGKPIHSFLKDLTCECIDWSLEGEARYSYSLLNRTDSSTDIQLILKGMTYLFHIPFSESALVENVIHLTTTLLELGMSPEIIIRGLSKLEPVEMRLETLKGIHASTIISDVYNSDLAGLGVALDVLSQLKKHEKKVLILSDVYQSGMDEADLYKEVAALVNFRMIDKLFCIGRAISGHKNLFPTNSEFYIDTNSFIQSFDSREIENSAVLIKGARKFQFERVTHSIQLLYHKTVLEINVNDLVNNLNYYRSLLNPGTRVMVMVKALSYGSGGDEIAGFLQHEKVDYLAVAYPDEGIKLRRSGLQLPIMVMNADLDDFKTLMDYELEPEIYSSEGLLEFIKLCSFRGRSDYPVHIKLDTGMHRLGFEEKDIDWLCEQLKREGIHVKSIFTHLAGSEDPGLDDFTREQVSRFLKMAEQIKMISSDSVMLHVLNSAGIERFPEYQFSMVRIGIGLYGQGISKNLHIVSSFKTVISQIREVKAGDTIGYGRMGKVEKDSKIATIPVGYADGIDRRLGNGNYSFYINGVKAPTVGNICMDMTMMDISGVDVRLGDTVELFGKNLPVSEMASKLDTIVYEVLTALPERVKRVYLRE